VELVDYQIGLPRIFLPERFIPKLAPTEKSEQRKQFKNIISRDCDGQSAVQNALPDF
jgi:hypothetical protein